MRWQFGRTLRAACMIFTLGCLAQPALFAQEESPDEEAPPAKEPKKEEPKKVEPPKPVERTSLDGNWVLMIATRMPTQETPFLVFSLNTKGEKPNTKVFLAAGGNETTFSDVKVDGDLLTAKIQFGNNKLDFEGKICRTDPKKWKVLGSVAVDTTTYPCSLLATDDETMPQGEKLPQPSKELKNIRAAGQDMNKIGENARKIVERGSDDTEAAAVAQVLLGMSEKIELTTEEATKWASLVEKAAANRGPRFEREMATKLATALASSEKHYDLSAKYAIRATNDKNASNGDRANAFEILVKIYDKQGKTDNLTKAKSELEKIETILDGEYLKKVPPFKTEKIARKEKSANKVAVVELFTGVQCPPCVAADVAFDALALAYDPKDVILLQYHEHIPGPDPLTNPDSDARMKFYSKISPEVGGTPTTIFNGSPKSAGGGGMANAEAKFKDYCDVINDILKESTSSKLEAKVTKADGKLKLTTEITGFKAPSPDLKIRVLIVEDHVRYAGPNGIRIHHCVVRSMLDKPEGTKLKDLEGNFETTIDLKGLRTSLTKYFEETSASQPYPRATNPLELKHLKAVVLVQDDDGGEILAATSIELPTE